MKKMFFLLFAFLQVTASFAVTVPKSGDPAASQIMVPLPASDQKISLSDFLELTPQAYKLRTGKRLGFKHTVEMRYAQRQLKSVVKPNGTLNAAKLTSMYGEGFHFHWGVFLLGFFLVF